MKRSVELAIKGIKRRLGFFGEGRAAKYLKNQGYNIIARNYRCPFGEVDIIAERGDVVAFTEVKTRSSERFGTPSEAVDADRMRRYVRCAQFYFSGRERDVTVRFDVIEVTKEGINHIENAFEGGEF